MGLRFHFLYQAPWGLEFRLRNFVTSHFLYQAPWGLILGLSVGLGISVPATAVQTILNPKDVSIGIAIIGFGGAMGSAISICASATLFQNRLVDEVQRYDPLTDTAWLKSVGLTDLQDLLTPVILSDVLKGVDQAVIQTLYMPVALSILTIMASAAMEWRFAKKKRS